MPSDKTSAVSADIEAVIAQLSALRDDVTKLAQTVAQSASERGDTLTKDITDGLAEATRFVGKKGHEADVRLEGAVAANPYLALGVAAGLGLLLGALMRR